MDLSNIAKSVNVKHKSNNMFVISKELMALLKDTLEGHNKNDHDVYLRFEDNLYAVSYTHLTLPTILLV